MPRFAPKVDVAADEDYLTVTPPGDDHPYKYFACHFLSPEKILKQKDLFYFEQFTRRFPLTQHTKCMENFVQFLSEKYGLDKESLHTDYRDFLKRFFAEFREYGIENAYADFLEKHETKLQAKFVEQFGNTCNLRAIKVHRLFRTLDESQEYIKKFGSFESERLGPLFIGVFGQWSIWDPTAQNVEDISYANQQVNRLYKQQIENTKMADVAMQTRIEEDRKKVAEDNAILAEKTGQKVTQYFDEETKQLRGLRMPEAMEYKELPQSETGVQGVVLQHYAPVDI